MMQEQTLDALFERLESEGLTPSSAPGLPIFAELPEGICGEGLHSWDSSRALIWIDPGQWALKTWVELSNIEQTPPVWCL